MPSKLLRYLLRLIAPAFGDDEPSAPVPASTEPTATPEQAAPAADAAKPTTMAEAMWNRDELGRFASKDGAPQDGQPQAQAAGQATAASQPGTPAQPAAAAKPGSDGKPAAEPAAAEDITAMPEGLGQKAQERFQKLVGAVRERDEQITELRGTVEYVQQHLASNGVTREQFEQALGVVGLLNSGDYRAALQVLDEQRRQIALALGEQVPGVDALSEFPDLRAKVDALHMTEADALEVAKLRRSQALIAQRDERVRTERQQAEQTQQAVLKARSDVDAWCRQMAAADIDWPAVEAVLLPRVASIVEGVPPAQWAAAIQRQYTILKEAARTFRAPSPSTPFPASAPAPAPLRATGQGGGLPAARTMHEAMWGTRAA